MGRVWHERRGAGRRGRALRPCAPSLTHLLVRSLRCSGRAFAGTVGRRASQDRDRAGAGASGEERPDGSDDVCWVGVVGGVAGAGDGDDAAVYQALVESEGRLPEDRDAVSSEQLEDRLAHRPEPLE